VRSFARLDGGLTVTNYGLVRAENLAPQLPQSDAFLRYEFFGTIPASLAAKQRITIPTGSSR